MRNYDKGVKIGQFEWVGKSKNRNFVMREDEGLKELKTVLYSFMLSAGLMLLGLFLSTYSGDIPGEESVTILLGKMAFYVGTIFLGIVTAVSIGDMIIYLQGINKYTKYEKMSYEEKMSYTFNGLSYGEYSKSEVGVMYDILNTIIELPNGYITYLNNILVGEYDGVRTTVSYRELSSSKSDEYKKLIVSGRKITSENIEDYYNTIYKDYKTRSDYRENIKVYNKLKEEEKERINQLNYIKENRELNIKKGHESSDYLAENVREQDNKDRLKETVSTLENIKEDIKRIEIK